MPAGHTCLRPPDARLGMAGSGTKLVECKLMGRRAVGWISIPMLVARNRLDFSYAPLDAEYKVPEIRTYVGDARSLDLIESKSKCHAFFPRFHIHTHNITPSVPTASRNGACCSDEVPVGEGCAAPVVRAGVEPGDCSSRMKGLAILNWIILSFIPL